VLKVIPMNAFDGRRTPLGPGVVLLLLTCLATAAAYVPNYCPAIEEMGFAAPTF
jgi:hypothetical protein